MKSFIPLSFRLTPHALRLTLCPPIRLSLTPRLLAAKKSLSPSMTSPAGRWAFTKATGSALAFPLESTSSSPRVRAPSSCGS